MFKWMHSIYSVVTVIAAMMLIYDGIAGVFMAQGGVEFG